MERLGLDFAAANTLEVADGRLTGRVVGEIVDRAGQGAGCCAGSPRRPGCRWSRRWRSATAPTTWTCWTRPGSGVAFNAKPVVREAADTAVNVPFLDTVLYLLGIPREEVEDADGPTAAH